MIYFELQDKQGKIVKFIVLEPENLQRLKEGKFAITPDNSVILGWTPDIDWFEQLLPSTEGDMKKIVELIEEGLKRPEVVREGVPKLLKKVFSKN